MRLALAVEPVRLHLGMSVGANISQGARAGRFFALLSLITLGVIGHLFPGMGIAAFDSEWTHVHVAILSIWQWYYEGTHNWPVVMEGRVAAQPTPVDAHVSECTK